MLGWAAWLWRYLTRRRYRRTLEVRYRTGKTERYADPVLLRRRGEMLEVRTFSGQVALIHFGAIDVIRERLVPRKWDKERRPNPAL